MPKFISFAGFSWFFMAFHGFLMAVHQQSQDISSISSSDLRLGVLQIHGPEVRRLWIGVGQALLGLRVLPILQHPATRGR